jgi:hypothetical protein
MKSLLLTTLLMFSAAAYAGDPLTVDQLKALIPGNSVSGFADALGKNYTAYYSPDGKLVQMLDNKLKRQGTWSITDEGNFCTQFPTQQKKCTKVQQAANGEYQRIKEDGMVTNTMKKFYKGNAYKY